MTVYVWDFPTRAFHWLLVLTFAAQYISGEILDDAMQWHFYGGYMMLGLIMFRVLWGIFGAYYARFSQFIHGPAYTLSYAKQFKSDSYRPSIGHNPMGAYSIIFVLSVLLTQAISGLFITDDIFHSGPYHPIVSEPVEDIMNWLHSNMVNAVFAFLFVHLGAMLVYKLMKKQNLVKAMITGTKDIELKNKLETPPINTKNHWLRFITIAALCALCVYLIVVTFAPEAVDDFYY
jgi:cytochrome b